MLLKKLQVLNFRQFIGEQNVEFATYDNRNVTVIMGENGSGKTTLAQAFTWCLYGDTDFDDKSVLNRIIERQLLPGNESLVRVKIDLIHGATDYSIIREQIYKREATGKIKAQFTTFKIVYNKEGQQDFITKPLEVEARIKQILPKELSKYFFFDGERIGNMSKEIKKGRSQEFGQAVRGLIGLNSFIAALDHLKPTSKNGVIGSYNESYDSTSDKRISQYTKDIQEAEDKLDKIEQRLGEIENEVQIARDRCDELNTKLMALAETEKLQKEKEKLKENLEKAKQARVSAISILLKQFNNNISSFLAKSLIKDALDSLSKAEKLDKGIPDIHARTIEFLINRKTCICGNKIEIGNDAYNELNKTLAFIPPQSIGTSIAQFIKESELRTKSAGDLFESFTEQCTLIGEYETGIEELINNIREIETQVAGKESSASIQQDLWRYEKVIRDRQHERDELNQEKGAIGTSRERKIKERAELTLRDENNKKIEIYKAYAQYMYHELSYVYKQNEDETRRNLELNINKIFKSIYEGGMSLTIDDKYNIQVLVKDDEGGINTDIETSTAQSISVIFAFISGIIKMARDNSKDNDLDTKMLESEPYPLVMDAPLSAFDKRRIKAVCNVLPNIAEQIIIFIKDTDGEIAEANLGEKIGRQYIFDKKNEFETNLMPR